MRIRLCRPSAEMEQQALDYRNAHFACGERIIHGSEQLDRIDDFSQWLHMVTDNANPETVREGWVQTDTFFALNEKGRIVGIIDLRRSLNAFLRDFGHCGYSVRPSERRKGIASEMLRLLCEHAAACGMQELQLSVMRSNLASVRTIIKNGGVLQRSFTHENAPADVYMITLNKQER